jgi:hypothetical protein
MFATCGSLLVAAAIFVLVMVRVGEPYVSVVILEVVSRIPESSHSESERVIATVYVILVAASPEVLITVIVFEPIVSVMEPD